MKEIGNGFKKIFKNDKDLLLLMLVLFVFGIVIGTHAILNFKVGGTTMYIGYSDIGEFSGGEFMSLWNSGGYRTGGWVDVAIFPVLGLILGVFHNLFAIQIYNRKNKGFAVLFVLLSILICIGAFVLLLRILGEV
ncbi:hypothetical protein IKF81_03390 [Candidatus Saccharibacteria bacterium]|nr:hypothetical protein [Candidatus Saccharibacteria bacterium]